MYRASSYPEQQDRPVLPSISRIFDSAPVYGESRHSSPNMTLPSYDALPRSRSDTWPQYPLVHTQGMSPRPQSLGYGNAAPRLHEPYADPRLSAQRTNSAMDTLTSARGRYPNNSSDDYDFSSASSTGRIAWSSSHTGFPRRDDSRRYDSMSYVNRYTGDSEPEYRSSYHDTLRHHSSTPSFYSPSLHGRGPSNVSNGARHECSYCGKRFSRPSGLKIHVTTHTGEKSYVCPEEGCHRSFSVRSNMRRHVRIVHHIEESTSTQGTSESGEGAEDRED